MNSFHRGGSALSVGRTAGAGDELHVRRLGETPQPLWVGSTPSAAMSVVGSAGIILTSCVVRAVVAGELRTTYTFRCETQEKNLPSRYKPGSRKNRALRALSCGFVSHSCAESHAVKNKLTKGRVRRPGGI